MLVKGDKLMEEAKREVLAMYGYRWTVENRERAIRWFANAGGAPRWQPILDAHWLADNAFHVKKNGHLDTRYKHAEPSYHDQAE